ncbi:MAG: hypothetical protein H0U12_00780 [Thermoleophilaceae bacterium]|nr:hypothetical protein [Thermoleophilaceae bacterium]
MAQERSPDRDPERIVLPSGKTIEVVRLPDMAAPSSRSEGPTARDRTAVCAEDAHLCPACDCSLVYPLAWMAVPPERWSVDLRCPNCERRETVVFDQDVADRFDEELESGAETLMTDLKRLTLANMADHVDRFVAALGAGAIHPMDF